MVQVKQPETRPMTEEGDFLQIQAIDYLHFYVGNAKQAMYWWWKGFGFKPIAYSGLETGNRDFASYVLESGKIRFVVSTPYGPSHEMAGHQLTHGDGVKVIAIQVKDVEQAYTATTSRGEEISPGSTGRIGTEKGLVRQFVAWPLGKGLTAAEQIGRRADTTGLQFRVFQGKPNRFPDAEPERKAREEVRPSHTSSLPHLGVGVGGINHEKHKPDPYGFESWESVPAVTFQVHLLNSEQFRAVTGEEPPPTPISAATYNQHKFPWFELLDEQAGDVGAQDLLSKLQVLGENR